MLILASESPRRKVLLEKITAAFTVVPPRVEELESGEELFKLPEQNALLKAGNVAERFPQDFVIGADTAVFAGNRMLGKPASQEEAAEMLALLGGKVHKVISGVAVICAAKGVRRSWSTVSEVRFRELSAGAVREYMEKVNVLDKAGAYAIQEHPELMGAVWEGETENIIGLPLETLKRVLEEYGLV